MNKTVREPISRPVWLILLSWGLGVLMIAGLLSFWIWKNEQDQERDEAALQLPQDRAVCGIIRAISDGPPPVPGPQGDRGRVILKALTEWQDALHCQELESANPGPARDRDHK
jgi:hypothetical protein